MDSTWCENYGNQPCVCRNAFLILQRSLASENDHAVCLFIIGGLFVSA